MNSFSLLVAILVASVAHSTSGVQTNFCGQYSCCNTANCNNCAYNCHVQCSSETCANTCINSCIQNNPQTCTGGNCNNFCSSNQCCNTQQCNTCAQTCTNQCSTTNCKSDCVNNCIQNVPQKCQSDTCNLCSGSQSQCCNTQHCNRCASSCASQCSTPSCKSNCVNKCIDTTPSCSGKNCDVCVGNQCCESKTCNNCVNKCYEENSGCTKACVNQCVQPNPIKIALPIPQQCDNDYDYLPVGGGSSNHSNAANITTKIDLHNVVNNTNHISIPVQVNNTNINNINTERKQLRKDVERFTPYQKEKTEPLNNHTEQCCYVLHPRECYYVNTNNTEREIKCIQRRHRECSELCTSPVVLIAPDPVPSQALYPQYPPYPQLYPQPYPMPPVQQSCHYMQQYPWVYCGNYQKHDCGDCYYCGEENQYQPQQCSGQEQCPQICRNNLFQRQ